MESKGKRREGGTRKCARISLPPRSPSLSLFLPAATAANGITRIPHFKRRFIHPTSAGLGRIDNWQNWYSVGGRATCAPGLETRVSPAAVASIFLAKLHPSPSPACTSSLAQRSLTLLSLFSITRLLRREEGEEDNAARPAIVVFFYVILKCARFRFMRIPWIRRRYAFPCASCHRWDYISRCCSIHSSIDVSAEEKKAATIDVNIYIQVIVDRTYVIPRKNQRF